MTHRNSRSALALLLAVGFAAPAEAQDLCADLRQALAQAAEDFAGLKTSTVSSSRNHLIYPARRLVPGAAACEVTEDRLAFRYGCKTTSERTAPAQARAAYARDVARVQRCFPDVKAERYRDPADRQTLTAWTDWAMNRQLTVRVQVMLVGEHEYIGSMNYSQILVEKSRLRKP